MGTAQNISGPEICRSVEDAQAQAKRIKECDFDRRELDLRKEQDALKDQRISNLERENDLLRQESAIKDRIIAVKDMEIASERRSFENMKEVSDRALKLAETSKPKSNWEMVGIIGLVAAIILYVMAK